MGQRHQSFIASCPAMPRTSTLYRAAPATIGMLKGLIDSSFDTAVEENRYPSPAYSDFRIGLLDQGPMETPARPRTRLSASSWKGTGRSGCRSRLRVRSRHL